MKQHYLIYVSRKNGVNQTHLIKNGKIGVLGHIAKDLKKAIVTITQQHFVLTQRLWNIRVWKLSVCVNT